MDEEAKGINIASLDVLNALIKACYSMGMVLNISSKITCTKAIKLLYCGWIGRHKEKIWFAI
jgi:hypothetical protein